MLSNPGLGALLNETLGGDWVRDLSRLRELERHADDAAFRQRWRAVKLDRKQQLAKFIGERLGIAIDPHSLFDIQAKRIHEYKRQHLNLLHVISLYLRIKQDPNLDMTPRTFVFAGKAAPGYRMAKLIIKLINAVAQVVNSDPRSNRLLKVVFFPNFNVTNAQRIYPAADLSEQISTAGTEASGTGNMKFAMNGALTIGTLDGANVEIRQAVGADNFFHFGLGVEGVRDLLAGGYQPRRFIEQNPDLRAALDLIASGLFSHGDSQLFTPFLDGLWNHDPYLVCADFADYVARQDEVGSQYRDRERWTRMSILNVARMGYFSSDRAVAEYCRDIWNAQPVSIAAD
jgi:starch phosphorylase